MPRPQPVRARPRSRVGDGLYHRTVALAARIGGVLWASYQRRTALIGGYALGLHGHVRTTRDLDLAIVTGRMDLMKQALEVDGLRVEYQPPGEDDPLGGLLRVSAPDCLPVEVINFGADRRCLRQSVGLAVVEHARPMSGCPVPVAGVPQLVALKLYAGFRKDLRDVECLLRGRAPDEIAAVRQLCDELGLGGNLDDLIGPTD
jgi:hypothetical protein